MDLRKGCYTVQRGKYLLQDTSIDCSTPAYQRFRVATLFFVAVYQSVPLVYVCLLLRHRRSAFLRYVFSFCARLAFERFRHFFFFIF